MTQNTTVDASKFDIKAFSAWLPEEVSSDGIQVTPIRGGGSCEMFRIDGLREPWVVRRAPVSAVSDTAHQVVREARIMQALASSAAPVPIVLGVCEDTSVLGAPFFVMSYVDGHVIRRAGLPQAYVDNPDSQPAIGEQLIDTLVSLHAFDWASSALVELSRPTAFLPRQVDRWMSQLARYRERDLPGIDHVADWLARNMPAGSDLTLMHGDYKIDNVVWSPRTPPEVVAVLDFEMTTIGDPLIDLAWALIFWPEDGNLISLAAPGTPNGMDPDRCQVPAELIARYQDATGRDLSGLDWYQAFSAWKLAIVLEASYAAFQRGDSLNPTHEMFGFVVDQLLLRAQRFAQ